jgi:hypothetical protein
VLPRKGRFITFASGRENPHRFTQVSSGYTPARARCEYAARSTRFNALARTD